MLTSLGRAAARLPSTAVATSSPAQLLRQVPSVARPAVAAAAPAARRPFTVSAWNALPAANKPAATGAKKSKTTSTTTKKTADKTKKKPAAKKAPAKKPKKEVDPEVKLKLEKRALKKQALLKEPGKPGETPWVIYLSREIKNRKITASELPATTKQLSEDFKTLSSYERQQLDSDAESNRLANRAAYKAWVEEQPAERIYLANRARTRLARLADETPRLIRDDRLPKRPGNAYNAFIKARFPSTSSGDSTPGRMTQLAQEWKALSEAERKPYEDMSNADMGKYTAHIEQIRARAKDLERQDKEESK